MDNQVLLYVMMGAVIVSAIALVMQMLILFGIYRTSQTIRERVLALMERAEESAKSASKELAETRAEVHNVLVSLGEVADSTKVQLVKVDETLTEMTVRARAQMDRVEIVLDDSLDRIQHAVTVVHNGVVKPVQQVTGVAAGVGAALNYFFRGGRPNVSEATMDEEMFI